MSVEEPGSFRIVATLAVAGVLSGFILVGAFLVTQPRIQANQAARLQAAVFRLLPGAERMTPLVVRDGRLEPYQAREKELPAEEAVFAGYDAQGMLLGYAVPAEGSGFVDTIRLLYAFDPRRRVIVGLEILESKETPGLGDKIIANPAFHASFEALAVEPEVVLQKRGPPQAPNEVDAISGATISSDAIVKILNRSVARWLPLIGAPPAVARQE